MWRDYVPMLKLYHNLCIDEWISRGFKNTMKHEDITEPLIHPNWWGDKKFHDSHKSNLLRKDPEFYSQFGWNLNPLDPYVWMDENGNFKDEMQALICANVLDLLNVFDKQGHSGSSAPYAINMFRRLVNFKAITPLTGEDWEWHDTGHNYQNKRASHVFKDYDGNCYDIDGKVFWEWAMPYEGRDPQEPFKSYYTSRESRVPVTFPYVVPDKPIYEYRHSDADPQQPSQNEEGFL